RPRAALGRVCCERNAFARIRSQSKDVAAQEGNAPLTWRHSPSCGASGRNPSGRPHLLTPIDPDRQAGVAAPRPRYEVGLEMLVAAFVDLIDRRGRLGGSNSPQQMEVVALARAAVSGVVDERADDVNAEAPDGALSCRLPQIQRVESQRIERRPVVDETHRETPFSQSERHSDTHTGHTGTSPMRYG